MAVSYTRTTWHNRAVQRPRTYVETNNADGSITHTPAPGVVGQEGTPLNEENLNNIEQGIVDVVEALNDALSTIETLQTALRRYDTRISNNERGITDIQAVDERQSTAITNLTAAHNSLSDDEDARENDFTAHVQDKDNPHDVTKAQVGLGNVPNVATNNQTPTYTAASSNQELTSGETLSVAFGKLKRAVAQLWAHMANTSNPHSVTKAQVGLGNVPNVTTNNQTPSYSTADSDQELVSGETLAAAFGKIKRAIARLWEHIADEDNPHNTSLFEATAVDFANSWGEPDASGSFMGNGSGAATISVNGTNCRGQQINLGFAPSKVAIFVEYPLELGYSESAIKNNTALDVACGSDLGVVLIGPNANYYHSGCGNYRTSAPQQVLTRNHGGAVVYGNGFIVQSYNNADTDSTMHMNEKNVRYKYMAWR